MEQVLADRDSEDKIDYVIADLEDRRVCINPECLIMVQVLADRDSEDKIDYVIRVFSSQFFFVIYIHILRKRKKEVIYIPELPPPKHDPELLTAEQLQAYKKIGFRNKNYCPVGVRGVFGGVVQNMHLHWKFHETVQVCCDNFPKEKIKEMAIMIARLSGGIVVNIHNVKTIIMYRGRNYRQPKNLIPINTLTKRKALFKARFEQALEYQKLNIKKIEQQLRRKGVNPEDPFAMASIQRVAATFFNAIDEKEGSPYIYRGDEITKVEPQRSLEQSDPVDDSENTKVDYV